MVVLAYKAIREFSERHKDVADSLNVWYTITQRCDWANFHEVKQTFNTVDAVGDDLYVFDIKGNHYRLIARISFRTRTVYIKFIGTHKAYDKVNLNDL